MQLRNSPLAKSPPANMAKIPGVTDFSPEAQKEASKENTGIKEDPKEGWYHKHF